MTDMMYFQKLHPEAIIPTRATEQSAGFDLYAIEDVTVIGGLGNIRVRTGIAVKLPEGTYGQIAMRSGLARDEHLIVAAGVIDPDYSGEVMVLVNCGKVCDDHTRSHI